MRVLEPRGFHNLLPQLVGSGVCSRTGLVDLLVARWKPSWQWKLNKTASPLPLWLTAHDMFHDAFNTVMDLARTWRRPGSSLLPTLSSNHLILMLWRCLVNWPSIYISRKRRAAGALNRISRYCAAHLKHVERLNWNAPSLCRPQTVRVIASRPLYAAPAASLPVITPHPTHCGQSAHIFKVHAILLSCSCNILHIDSS